MKSLSISLLQAKSTARAKEWHGEKGIEDWSTMEWACATAGEMGEACNVAKKLHRIRQGIARNPLELEPNAEIELRHQLAEECADVLCYLVLLAERESIDLENAVINKFNKISEAYGFPQRI